MVDDQLAPPAEEVAEPEVLPLRAVEPVILVDSEPGHRAPPGGELVAEPGEVLLFGEQQPARGEPFVFRRDWMIRHGALPPVARARRRRRGGTDGRRREFSRRRAAKVRQSITGPRPVTRQRLRR